MLRALAVLILLAGPCWADMPGDSPLDVVPRTAKEAARIAAVTAPTTDFTKPEQFEGKPGGGASVRVRPTPDVFSQFSGNMGFDHQMTFNLGNALFTKAWVPAPASTMASDGLGPLFNARGCQDCHLKDGRGHVPLAGEAPVSLFLRLSVPGGAAPDGIADWIATLPEPVYGGQLQTFSTASVPAEAAMTTTYTEQPVQMNGDRAPLRVRVYAVTEPANGTAQADVLLSPRMAP
ncbi:MAG: thiol oxidoreductase, partial [Pseudorhodobacter sp.]|nr:thiol oxidoreductase [Pseudorhodobacter sp.]